QQEQKAAPETPTGRRAITNVQLRDLSQADATAIAQRGDHLIQNPDTGQYVGAPRGIDTPEKLQAMRDRFDAVAETGIPGRMWYPNSRSAVTEITGGDTQRARLAASEMGLWSPQATPETNLGAMLQGHNAYEAGQPLDIVRTGAQARNYQAAREAGGLPSLGKKTGPFAAHLDPTQVSPSTSVNDIWHARAFSYTNKDGSTFDRALTPQEHSFLDAETLLAADRANQKQLGGFSDWGSGNVQASAWVGAKAQALMAKHPEMTMEEALEESKVDFSDVLQKHTAAGTYEQIPGAGTGHLPSLVKAPYGTRAGYSDVAPWTNPQGEDILYRSTGLYQRPTVKAQGYFTPPTGSKTPEVNPAFTARPLIDYTPSKAGPTPSDVSRGTMDAVETTRAYFDAQNMGGWHKLLTSGQAGQMDSAFVPMNRSLSPEEMTQLGTAVGKHGLSPSDTGQGVSLLNFGKGPKPADMPKLLKGDLGAAIKSVLPDAEPTRTRQFGNALLVDKNYNALMAAKNQGKGKATRALFKAIDNPAIPDIAGKLDTPELRQQALTLLERDEAYAAKTGDPIRQDIQNARRIVGTEGPEGGLDGLRKALAEGRIALPAVAGLVGLGAAAMPGRAQAAERGSQMPRLNPDQQALADAARRHMIARALAAQGQNGDTMLAHISPDEAAALQRGGGAGTRNPRTGLPQFYRVDSGGPGNVDDSGDDNGDPRKHPDYNPTGGTVGAPDPNLGLPGGASGAFNATGAGGSAPGAQPVDPTADDFQTASTALGNRGFASRAAGWLEPYGLHTVTPVEGDPSTYGPGGSLRHELNPAAFAGNAAGMAFGNPLLGMLGGLALGKGYEALGGPQIALGKSGKDASQDTMLAHVKPGTAAALKLAGGSGLPDWFTGLFHFAGSDPGVLERIAAGMYSRDRAAGPVSATPLAHPLTPPDIPVIPIAGGMPGSDMSALNPHVNQAYGVPAGTYPGGAVPGGLTAAQLGAALALGGGPAGGGPQSSVYGLTSQEPQDQGGQDSMPTPAPGALGGRDRSRTNSDRNRLYRLARIGLLMGPYATS
ncbi:MAG TPA: hypothetical protein VH184_15895, partial [Dongiaceae bacterium]|nr:hypothetical protein [Dongiaceae bacterium]